MTRLWDSGAEFNTLTASGTHPTLLNGGMEMIFNDGGANFVVDATTKRSGNYSFKVDSGAGSSDNNSRVVFADIGVTGTLGRNYYFRGYWYFPSSSSFPSGTVRILMAHKSAVSGLARVDLTSSGTLYLGTGNSGNQVGSATGVLNKDQWYRVELRWKTDTGAADECEFRLDGTQIAVTTGASISDNAADHFYFSCPDNPGANRVWYVDDLAFNDDQGSAQNSWCGPGKIGLSLPISDNARGTWTGGVGGTTNLYQAIDNTPPVGTASETDTSQIESNANSGSAPADFNMTAPSTLGMGANDIMRVARLTVVHGEDVTTGTKTGSMTVVSNPAQGSSDTFTFGDNQATALGTWPSFWVTRPGTTLYDPSVTPSTSPVARVTKTDTTTRVASVCFMGITFEWEPQWGIPLRPMGSRTYTRR